MKSNEQNLKVLATKEDVANTNQKIVDLRAELKENIANLRTEVVATKAEMINGCSFSGLASWLRSLL